MTLPIARDLSEKGIRVVTIVPGFFRTPMCIQDTPDEVIDFISETVQFPERLGEPKEYADLVETIVDNPMLNGVAIRIDGAGTTFEFDF